MSRENVKILSQRLFACTHFSSHVHTGLSVRLRTGVLSGRSVSTDHRCVIVTSARGTPCRQGINGTDLQRVF
jgi:hypothetical protein